LLSPAGVPETILPLSQNAVQLFEIPLILEMKSVVIVVFLGPGNEELQGLLPVFGQGKRLDISYFLLRHEAKVSTNRGAKCYYPATAGSR
jgi:hypothetical protein